MHVLYVLAQASTDDVTASPKHPSLGRHPAGPTQGTPAHSRHPWAAVRPLYSAIRDPTPDPFSRTHARGTRRGGPKRALCAARGPPASTWHSASPPRAPSEMFWVGAAAQRRRVRPARQLKTPSGH